MPATAVRPNAGLEAIYRRRLQCLVEAMHKSVVYWLCAAYKSDTPEMAMDMPATTLAWTVARLKRQWYKKFSGEAKKLAWWFSKDAQDRSDYTLKRILKDHSVKFVQTPAMKDVLQATIKQNVSLIKSIPQEYLSEVEGLVMRSVQQGRKLDELTDDIELLYDVTRKRAALIAVDQNNKATSAMTKARQLSLGITEGTWFHSHAGKKPRPTHKKMNGRKFKLAEGMYDPHEKRRVMPGELIHCRCTWRPVIPGLGT